MYYTVIPIKEFDPAPPPHTKSLPAGGGQGNSFWTRMDTCAFNSIGETTVKSQYPCPMVNQFKHLYRGPVVTSILTKNCKKQSPLREWKTYSEARF